MKAKPLFYLGIALVIFLFSAYVPVQTSQRNGNKFVVVLDAGHGGHDPGNLGNGYLEKNIALGIVLATGKALESETDIKVVYTRKEDKFVDLYVRGEIANKAKADLFVSVHCDSHSSDAYGAGTFVMGLHANKQNFEIAKKENSVIYLEDNYETRYAAYDINSPQSIIGLTIMQEEFLDQSILLGKMMQDNFTKNLNRKDRKVKQAGFIVLHQTFMPSVLIETGFLTNKNEGAYLNSKKGQTEMGKAIADAIVLYKDNLWGESTAFSEPSEGVITSVPEVQDETEEVVEEEQMVADKGVAEKDPTTGQEEVSTEVKEAVEQVKEETIAKEIVDEKEAVPSEVELAAVEKELKTKQEPVDVSSELPGDTEMVSEVKKETESRTEDSISETAGEQTKKIEKEEVSEKPAEKAEEVAVISKADEVSEKPVREEPKKEEPATKSKANITFKVQILASSKQIPLNSGNFNGLSTISKEPYKNLFRYMYGRTNSYNQAKLLKSNADMKGYTTSFIVAYKDGVRIPVQEAMKYATE